MIVREGASYPLRDAFESRELLFARPPTIGVVIGTFAAVPYVHLQLEARRRCYPQIPLLVHDDGSHKADELEALCEAYGATYERNEPRLPPCRGDLAAFVGGFRWAQERGIDLLVKLSRRFVPIAPWVEDLCDLAMRSHYATFCSWTTTYNFGFRSECVGMAVGEWLRLHLVAEITAAIAQPVEPFVEGLLHQLARRAAAGNCRRAQAYDAEVGLQPDNRAGYAVWPFMGTDRATSYPGFLWHNSALPEKYARVAQSWGLPYTADDFADPNQGGGVK